MEPILRHQSSYTRPESMVTSPGLMKRVLHVRRTTRLSRSGKVRSLYALVLVGNGKGAAGYGEGKASDMGGAIDKATRRAIRNLTPIDRYDGRTIYNDIEHTFVHTHLTLRPAPPGYGISANDNIHEICRAAGIQDLSAKVRGSTNPMNVVKGTCTYLV
jgi:ribosomal protein S5